MARTIKSVPEMAKAMEVELSESEKKRRIYKAESEAFKKKELQTDICRAISALSGDRIRVDFDNVEDVRQRIIDYLTACYRSGIYPSVQGLAAHGFGISRQALNQWRIAHSDTQSARLIDMATDLFADVLTNQSLHNNANPVQALFQLKNNHAFADRVEIQPVKINDDTVYSPAEIRERLGLPEEE